MLKAFLPLLILASSVSVFGATGGGPAPCRTLALSVYESRYAPPSPGCEIGILEYSDFVYRSISNAPADNDILITPSGQGFSYTLADGSPFSASLGEIVQFEIDYKIFIDPAPVIAGADNNIDPPTGNVAITEFFCNDSVYQFEGSCGNSNVEKLSVGTPVTGYPYSAGITFQNPALSYQTVGILFTLDGTNGASSFDAFTADETVISGTPEPALSGFVGLLLLGGAYKKFRKPQRAA